MKISIITPSYNSSPFIERAIQSVLNQDYNNWEHIVIDGGSTDGTIDILKKYDHIKWISEPDQGQSDAMNKGFKLSTGDIIVYLNADDEFEPIVFTKIVKYFNENPSSNMVIGQLRFKFPDDEYIRTPSTYYQDIIYNYNLFPANPVSYFYRRHMQKSIGEFPLSNHYTMDYWFLLHAYKNNKIGILPLVFGTFHFDGTNKTAVTNARDNLDQTLKQFLLKHDLFHLIKKYFIIKLVWKINRIYSVIFKTSRNFKLLFI